MTVKELIKILEARDPDDRIFIEVQDFDIIIGTTNDDGAEHIILMEPC